jgi:hypothetical protein
VSIYEGLEDGLAKAAAFMFEAFRVDYLCGNHPDVAKERFKDKLKHLIEAHEIAVDIMEEVLGTGSEPEGPS